MSTVRLINSKGSINHPCSDNLIDEEELLELAYSAYEAGNYSPTLLKPGDLEEDVSTV